MRFIGFILECLNGFESITGDGEHRRFIPPDMSVVYQLFRGGECHTASGFGEDSFCSSEEFDGFYDFSVGSVFADPAGVSDGINSIDPICWISDSQGFSDCVWSDRLHKIAILFVGVDNGATTFRLGNVDFSVRFVY